MGGEWVGVVEEEVSEVEGVGGGFGYGDWAGRRRGGEVSWGVFGVGWGGVG